MAIAVTTNDVMYDALFIVVVVVGSPNGDAGLVDNDKDDDDDDDDSQEIHMSKSTNKWPTYGLWTDHKKTTANRERCPKKTCPFLLFDSLYSGVGPS
jgi:hypothetical protein